jgi:hypothetical protein
MARYHAKRVMRILTPIGPIDSDEGSKLYGKYPAEKGTGGNVYGEPLLF